MGTAESDLELEALEMDVDDRNRRLASGELDGPIESEVEVIVGEDE